MAPLERQAILSKTGKLALFMRLYRSWMLTPSGKTGFLDRFPEPRVAIHDKIYTICGQSLKKCVDSVYSSIQSRSEFLFPKRNQKIENFVFDEEQFRNLMADSMFGFDVTISYFFCFLTKNRLEFLKNLPFCDYDIDGPKTMWPANIFRDFANQPLFPLTDDPNEINEPIDVLDNTDFTCADESFCPDPCCGRRKNRTTFCAHEICREHGFSRRNLSNTNIIIYSCKIDDVFNDDFFGLSKNQWNISCSCPNPGFLFRFDTLRCVDVDECKFGQSCLGKNEECVNKIGGFFCECALGFVRLSDEKCHPLNWTRNSEWNGVAHTTLWNDAKRSKISTIWPIFLIFQIFF